MCQTIALTHSFSLINTHYITMKPKKRKINPTITLNDYIKASRIGNREAKIEIKGPGFHSTSRIHKSKKTYSRKSKHKGIDL